MSATSSAIPANLQVFVTSGGAATSTFGEEITRATPTVQAFYQAPCDPRFRPAGDDAAFRQAGTQVTDNQGDERWIDVIRAKFVEADSNSVSNADIASALSAAGVSAAAPAGMTADEPVYQGATMYSGWSDDPVSTGAGHFLEVEEDLAMPVTSPCCAGPGRTAPGSSAPRRRAGAGTAGPRPAWWYIPTKSSITGPTVRSPPSPGVADAYLRHPGMEAELEGRDDGYRLCWRWNGRFPGMIWDFDGEGRLCCIRSPLGGLTTASYEDNRLMALTHEGGRSLAIEWDGPLVVGVTASDGRWVRYEYLGEDLVSVHGPAGDRRYVSDAEGRIAEVFDADDVRLAANTYDEEGRVLAQESPFGHRATYTYLAPSTVVVGDDDDGPRTLFRHDDAGRLTELHLADGTRSARHFDELGNPVQVDHFDGTVTRRLFDVAGNCVREVRPGRGERTFSYDALGRMATTVDEAGAETRLTYQGRQHGSVGGDRSPRLSEVLRDRRRTHCWIRRQWWRR